MKKSLFASYIDGILERNHGERYRTLLGYFFPEFITALFLYSLIYFLDAWFIAHLKSTSTYATLGTTNTMIHFLTKMAEGFSVATIVLSGNHNGRGNFKRAGKALSDAFWVTCIAGTCIASILFFGAYWIYYFYGVPEKMIAMGTPYLRLRAVAILFMFIYFAFIGFLRGIKNTRAPMTIFLIGGAIFLFFDYGLIFGNLGFPQLKLQGSALASVIQYGSMLTLAIGYIFLSPYRREYGISLFSDIANWSRIKELLRLSWPVMLDKSTLAIAYLWLGAMINPMGKYAIASYTVIKDLERLAIIPAAAFAQVVTFLVSNSYGKEDWDGIKTNIKKIIFLASIFVFFILGIFCLKPHFFIHFFDQKGKFTDFASRIFPFISVLVIFDVLQLILAGALRGAANVRVVMWVRLAVFLLYFVPISILISRLNISSTMLKFFLMYGAFYIGNGIMSCAYIWRFRCERWKTKSV